MTQDDKANSNEPTEPRHHSKRRGRKKHRPTTLKLRDLLKQFVACGRCGYFLAGYRVLHGVEALEEAAAECDDGWLELIWDQQTRHLVHQSYGVRPEPDFFYYDICCEECQRRIVYEDDEELEEEMEKTFRVDVKLL